MKVKHLIKALQKLDPEANIKAHEKTSVYDTEVVGVNVDEYEKKRGKNVIMLTLK